MLAPANRGGRLLGEYLLVGALRSLHVRLRARVWTSEDGTVLRSGICAPVTDGTIMSSGRPSFIRLWLYSQLRLELVLMFAHDREI